MPATHLQLEGVSSRQHSRRLHHLRLPRHIKYRLLHLMPAQLVLTLQDRVRRRGDDKQCHQGNRGQNADKKVVVGPARHADARLNPVNRISSPKREAAQPGPRKNGCEGYEQSSGRQVRQRLTPARSKLAPVGDEPRHQPQAAAKVVAVVAVVVRVAQLIAEPSASQHRPKRSHATKRAPTVRDPCPVVAVQYQRHAAGVGCVDELCPSRCDIHHTRLGGGGGGRDVGRTCICLPARCGRGAQLCALLGSHGHDFAATAGVTLQWDLVVNVTHVHPVQEGWEGAQDERCVVRRGTAATAPERNGKHMIQRARQCLPELEFSGDWQLYD